MNFFSFSTDASDAQSIFANGIYMEPYRLRNCDHRIMTVTNAETDEVYYVDDTQYLPKAYYANEDMTLLYDDEEGCFTVFDDTVALGEYEGEPYYPSEYYYIWLFICEDSGFEPDFIDIV